MRYLFVFALLALTLPADASPPARGIELTPIAGYRGGGGFEDTGNGESLDLDASASYDLILNIDHDANTQWEFMFSRQNTPLKPGPTVAPGFVWM